MLDTQAGETWQIEAKNHSPNLYNKPVWVSVHRGQTCLEGTPEILGKAKMFAGTGSSEVKILSGGGRYMIGVHAQSPFTGAVGYISTFEYTLTATRGGSGGDRLAPGEVVQVAADIGPATASTVASRADATTVAGQTIKDCPTCPEMLVLPAGQFMMGSLSTEIGRGRDEGPRHPVTFTAPFAIGRTEVTFEQWNVCVDAGGCLHRPADEGWGQATRPIINVSWSDARAYAAWLSESTGQKYFLPSESEWEYAARAGGDTAWSTGDAIIIDDANLLSQFGKTVAVGGFPPNAFGLHDMHGNVAEWVQDCYDDTGYFGAPADGGARTGTCVRGVVRGGGFADEPALTRSAARRPSPLGQRLPSVGFRVARAL
ncbi:formylglycine-generating enzyme family protein [Caulobacter henricii]|uniref:Sulfatase-modifying factor enzyme-like domain-containing protein n=1 Tax=Caulobacter henricii TaxID=69395 RepID=A0A0P0P2Z6_9CAUL|nr:formylglycine-generating enzyme family protein [Caulobacter henricii]ALL14909.1 hypothetical protein AQ619_16905 [Caulobacter henricii]